VLKARPPSRIRNETSTAGSFLLQPQKALTFGSVSETGALFSFRMVPLVASLLGTRRIDARPLLVKAGLPDEALRGPVIAPLARVQRFLELSAEAVRHPLFGVELAERVPNGAMGVTEFLMKSAASAERSFEVLCEFAPLINTLLQFRLRVDGDQARLHFTVPARRDGLGPQLNEYTFVLAARQFAIGLGAPLPLQEIWFSHARDGEQAALEKKFGCPVRFGAGDCGWSVPRSLLEVKPVAADEALHAFLLAQARAELANAGTRDVITQVARTVEMRLGAGDVSAEAIAKAMAITVRSLQRHLKDAGTSFRDVLLYVRRRRHAELSRGGLSDAEIADRLGFSNPSAMRRSLA
jgi:AraC-like DNA-binding protein